MRLGGQHTGDNRYRAANALVEIVGNAVFDGKGGNALRSIDGDDALGMSARRKQRQDACATPEVHHRGTLHQLGVVLQRFPAPTERVLPAVHVQQQL